MFWFLDALGGFPGIQEVLGVSDIPVGLGVRGTGRDGSGSRGRVEASR